MCLGSMLPQRLKEILQCTHTHAHTASAGCLPLNLLNAHFRCVALYSRVGALWHGWLDFIVIRSQGRSVYLQMLLWCMKESVWELCGHVRHMLFYHLNISICLFRKRTWIIGFGIFVNDVSIWHWASVPLVGALCTLRCEGALRSLPLILKTKTGVQSHCSNPFLFFKM